MDRKNRFDFPAYGKIRRLNPCEKPPVSRFYDRFRIEQTASKLVQTAPLTGWHFDCSTWCGVSEVRYIIQSSFRANWRFRQRTDQPVFGLRRISLRLKLARPGILENRLHPGTPVRGHNGRATTNLFCKLLIQNTSTDCSYIGLRQAVTLGA